jgi:hypothetical protein
MGLASIVNLLLITKSGNTRIHNQLKMIIIKIIRTILLALLTLTQVLELKKELL